VINTEVKVDPYAEKTINLAPDQVVDETAQMNAPRGVAVAADNSLYVADSRNNRILHLSATGEQLQAWGTYKNIAEGEAPGGTFNEPWGVAVGPDGSVYVTDTWNHRVEKFTAEGQFVTMWGYFGQAEKPEAFWGPRGIAVDAEGHVYVMDTGNKRIVIFNSNGEYIAQFGSSGMDDGQFDEPVGVALDADGNVYVTDTWNQRVQVFAPDSQKLNYTMVKKWDVNGWFGQSLDNKPFITVDKSGNVYVTDPEGYRVLEFDGDGQFVRGWGDYSTGTDGFGMAAAVAVDSENHVWVSDAGNNRLLRFSIP
jgi:DNA-binding beta-propeller fold protein YncE